MYSDPPAPVLDGGFGWLVLMGTFTAGFMYGASVFTLGLYMVEWQEHFDVGAAAVSSIATAMTFMTDISGLVGATLCKLYGCRPVMLAGSIIFSGGYLLGAFSKHPWQLYIVGGVLGTGQGLLVNVMLVAIRFYFDKRLGLANGVTFAGVGAGFLIAPPLVEAACREFGWQGALLIHAAVTSHCILTAILTRPTKLEQQAMEAKDTRETSRDVGLLEGAADASCLSCRKVLNKIDDMLAFTKLFRNRLFVVFLVVGMFAFCQHITTAIFMAPKLVYDMGFSPRKASIAISVCGIFSFLSRLLHGLLLDYHLITVTNLFILALVGTGVYPLMNPWVMSDIGQFVLVAFYGTASGVLISTTFLVCRQYVAVELVPNAFGIFAAVCGLSSLLSTQLGGTLYDATGSYDIPFFVVGAGVYAAAIFMAYVTKCSCWKETKENSLYIWDREADDSPDVRIARHDDSDEEQGVCDESLL